MTPNSNQISCNLFGRWINKFDILEITSESITLFKKDLAIQSLPIKDLDNFASLEKSIFGYRLCLGEQLSFGWLNKGDYSNLLEALNSTISEHVQSRIELMADAFNEHALVKYPKDSKLSDLEKICSCVESFIIQRPEMISMLSPSVRRTVDVIRKSYPFNAKVLRHVHEGYQLERRSHFYDLVETNPLTQEQRLAVIRNNDRNMVLAAAGTGKTSVMVAKALDLIDRGLASADQILILAYNKTAATELEERIKEKAKKSHIDLTAAPKASTFHALGLHILKVCGERIRLSEFAESDHKLDIWITRWLHEYLTSNIAHIPTFIELLNPPLDPLSFSDAADYQRYVRDNEFTTLKGDKVKGYQELLIANFLFINGVEYEYEGQYLAKKRIDVGFDYLPDFHITGTNIYLEHFGISRDGSTRQDIDAEKYNTSIKRKRKLHEAYGTTLLETYHYDWKEGTLNNRLKILLEGAGVSFNPLSEEEILITLKESDYVGKGSALIRTALAAIRAERLGYQEIFARLDRQQIVSPEATTELLWSLHQSYVGELESQASIDFDDMIIKATELVKGERFRPQWRYILIDEFQDISSARMNLVNTIIEHSDIPSLTVVGDDWQSIYRFSGGKLELTTGFNELIGPYTETKLQKTFRYNNSIATTAGLFVMENPNQFKKDIDTHTKVEEPQVYLLDDKINGEDALYSKMVDVIKKIRTRDNKGTIAVIARYNFFLRDARERLSSVRQSNNIEFWSFHKSKGLEADYCILIGFTQGKNGFPSDTQENAIIEALLPSLDSYPDSEERRLLYVGITRAKKKCYIIADPSSPSKFVTELLEPKYEVGIYSDSFRYAYQTIFKCPNCVDGYLKKIKGQHSHFYVCSTGKGCKVGRARSCDRCGSPSIDSRDTSQCQNPSCSHSFKICEECGRPMKKRAGKYGSFWGCSGFSLSQDSCKNTQKIEDDTQV